VVAANDTIKLTTRILRRLGSGKHQARTVNL
jgi:hypothetical protein